MVYNQPSHLHPAAVSEPQKHGSSSVSLPRAMSSPCIQCGSLTMEPTVLH
jgi:hypothetical protein